MRLPEPFGRCRTIVASGTAPELLPSAVGARAARVHLSFLPKALNAALLGLNAAGLAARLPLAAFTTGRGRPPIAPSRQPTAHWVNVRRRGSLVASRIVSGDGDYRMSTAATLVFADLLTSSLRSVRGLLGIDEIVRVADVAPTLAAAGVTVGPGA
jgi:hypothetical protein